MSDTVCFFVRVNTCSHALALLHMVLKGFCDEVVLVLDMPLLGADKFGMVFDLDNLSFGGSHADGGTRVL